MTKTTAFVANSLTEILQEIKASLPQGFFHYSVLKSWHDVNACDQEIAEEIDKIKNSARNAGFVVDAKYLRLHLTGLLLATDAGFFGPQARYGDLRKTPIDFAMHRVTYKPLSDGSLFELSLSLGPDWYEMHKARQIRLACKNTVEEHVKDLLDLLKVRSPEINAQIESILNAVNQKRRASGLDVVPHFDLGLTQPKIIELSP